MGRPFVNLVLYLLSFITLAAAAANTGQIPFNYQGSEYKTWYTIYTPPRTVPSHRPLLVLHGGPGFSYNYMDSIQDLSSTRPVIFYDQIGNGRSTHLDTQPDAFWTIDLFMSELKNVIKFFKCDSFDILGHSWGGMLGAEYAVSHLPGLNKLVLSDSLAAMSPWTQSQVQLLSTFPTDVQQGLMAGFSDPVRYRAALTVFYNSHGCTVQPWPASLTASIDALFADPNVSIKMAPVLSTWTIVDRLKDVRVPTLVINGVNDIAQDFVIQPFLDHIPNVAHVKFQHSSHTPMWEERDLYMATVAKFLG